MGGIMGCWGKIHIKFIHFKWHCQDRWTDFRQWLLTLRRC